MYYVLAIDIGASSGRHILGSVQNGKLFLQEIYRFENNLLKNENSLLWDISHLLKEVVTGIKECKKLGKIPKTVSIDTWGVDYVLIDKNGKEILPAFSYRDSRTNESSKEVLNKIDFETLYEKTGIQMQNFNTIFQLHDDKSKGRLVNAKHFLMIPEYLSYKLTGNMKKEYTNASTTGLLNALGCDWDFSIIEKLGIEKELFENLLTPSTEVGKFSNEIKEEVGFDSTVIFSPSHDTASAVAACPLEENNIFISSGTWSLIGCELLTPITTEKARLANFTNEGGIDKRFRFLKNIMGMWLFQNIRKNLDKKYSYDEMMKMAMSSNFTETVDVNAPEFVAPENMLKAVNEKLGKPNLPLADTINCVYHSLAKLYAKSVKEIESITGKTFERICIVGGGCKDEYLNQLTAKYTGKKVTAGPVEATATGNIISQLIYNDSSLNLCSARELVKKSFEIKEV
ncbi:MAG: rhamnulokinase [Clostridia bacterium]|nr:rhamnulokinase [Clostridia bacterium]